MQRRIVKALVVLALAAFMFGSGYVVAERKIAQATDITVASLKNTIIEMQVKNTRADGAILENLLTNKQKRASEFLQNKYYVEILALDELEFKDNIFPDAKGDALLAGRYLGSIAKAEAQTARFEAIDRLKRFPFQLSNAQWNDQLVKLVNKQAKEGELKASGWKCSA